jgi:TetR/AcrR family transcriptional repressor of nem operon
MAKRTNKEHRESSIAAMLAAAEYLFVTRGYNATTTEQIGRLAGLTKGAVYFYFTDKEGVLLELLSRVREAVMMPLRRRLRNVDQSPTERMAGFLEFGGSLSRRSPGSMLLPIVVSIEFAGSGSIVESRVKAGYRKVREELQDVLELGQKLGEFRNDLSADEMSRALIATNDGLMLECLRNDLALHVDRLVATLNAIILSGISRTAQTDRETVCIADTEDTISVIDVMRSRFSRETMRALEPVGKGAGPSIRTAAKRLRATP